MTNKLILFLSFICFQISCFAQPEPVGIGWAQNSVNGVVFRKNSIVTHENTQYVAWYNPKKKVMLAKRKIGTSDWQVKETQHDGNTKDAHNSISIMVDGDGYLHMAWDHHGQKLNYCKSVEPGSLELSDKMIMTGYAEHNVTYPEFHRLPDGNLIFFYRNGSSGNGNLVLNKYDVKEKVWTRVHDVLIDGENERNAYWQACVDVQGTIHLSWVWRETGDVATNHDICYAQSKDFGKTWQKSTGEKYEMPVSLATAEYAAKIPQNSTLMNQTSMFADSEGNPYIANSFTPKGGVTPQFHVFYKTGDSWEMRQVSSRTKPFSLKGGGTKKLDLSRPQIMVDDEGERKKIFLIYRDIERGNKATISLSTDKDLKTWKTKDITDFSLGDWEPSYDTELWKNHKKLHLYVQKMGQGDGEKLQKMKPQPVYVWEVNIE